MTTIDYTPFYRNSIGFDRFLNLLDLATNTDNSKTGYPPYNIEVMEENRYAITLAVAGFEENELDIQVKENLLTITGNKPKSDKEHQYLYQGIAERNFERKFNLADYVEVTDAKLKNGLLMIHLLKKVPETMKPRTISINSSDAKSKHLNNETSVETKEKAA
ncbi:MAG: Hsp20 family protein [Gammaproteobacteria bacterium]|nr:Hsp20 family protein [Gammaproteobacteria bacterium]